MTTPVHGGPLRRAATRAETGRACPYCRFPLKEGEAMAQCGECAAPHHADCWNDNGNGCAIVACSGGPTDAARAADAPTAVVPPPPARPAHAAAPPSGPPAVPVPAAPPTPPARSGPWILAAAIVVAVALAGATLALVLSQSQEGPAADAEPVRTAEPTASEPETAPPPETTPDAEEDSGSAADADGEVPALDERITAAGWVAEAPSSAEGWTLTGPDRENGGRQIVRTMEGPAGEVILIVHTPDARARPAEKYIHEYLPMTTAAEETELVTVDNFPTPACESRRCSDILLNDSAYGGIAILVNGERGDAAFAVADAIARTVRRTDQADEDPHMLAPAPGSDESLSPETYDGE